MLEDDLKDDVVGEEDFSTTFIKKGANEDTVIGALPEEDNGDDEDTGGRWGNDDLEEETGE